MPTKTRPDFVTPENMALLTDLYELTMCQAYFQNKKHKQKATFDLFIRKLPKNRSYFIACGLEQALFYLKNLKFDKEALAYLKERNIFSSKFLNYLKNFKFTGDVYAVPEGTLAFPEEPILRITGPILEAQFAETFLLNTINLQTMIATKASRVVYAAKGRGVVDFGLRRTPGYDAGIKAARASYIGGCIGTSNVLGGMLYKIPIFGTMAHSFVMSYKDELESFKAFTKTYPKGTTLLIDTYDTPDGARKAACMAKGLEKKGFKLGGVRLDSGDLAALSKEVRKILDDEALKYVRIFASGDLDEYRIQELLRKGAKIDAFGVGTRMNTSSDYPYCDVVYKLSEREEDGKMAPVMKLSEDKVTYPGKKNIYRITDKKGMYVKDILGLEKEFIAGKKLLVPVVEKGKMVYRLPSLDEIRSFALHNLKRLPERYKKLENPPLYRVEISPSLKLLAEKWGA